MRVFTQADFDALVRDENGYLHCDSGDWTHVQFGGFGRIVFDNNCKPGNRCKLGDWCELGNMCRLEKGRVEYAVVFKISNIGSRNDSLYCYCNTRTGAFFFRAGCWFSDAADFEARVQKVHGGTQYETDYLAAIEFAKARFARYAGKETCKKAEHDGCEGWKWNRRADNG